MHAGAGLSSGLKSVGKGVAVGAASLFVLPAVGAAQQVCFCCFLLHLCLLRGGVGAAAVPFQLACMHACMDARACMSCVHACMDNARINLHACMHAS